MMHNSLSRTDIMTQYCSIAQSFFDRVVLEHPKIVIVCMLAAVVFFGFEAKNFKLDASADTLLLENDKDLRYSRLISSRYGEHSSLVLMVTPRGGLFSEQALATLGQLRDDLKSEKSVLSVISILDVPLFESPPVSLKELTEELPTLSSGRVDRDMAKVEFRDSPIYRNLLVSPDLKTTALLVNFIDDALSRELVARRDTLWQKKISGSLAPADCAELKDVVEQLQQHNDEIRFRRHQDIVAIRKIMDKYRGDAALFLGGGSMITDDMITFIKNDLKVFGAGVLMFLILTLGIIFRRIRWVCFPILCCGISVICMIGLLGWLGWKVTVVSSNFISLQLITTIAIVIYLIVRYRELLVKNPQAPNRQLISDTIRMMLKPCWYTAITTIAGFGSLVLCNILPVIMFGWMMMISLIVSLIVSFLFFPAILVLMPKETPPDRQTSLFSLTPILARFTEAHGVLIIVISSLVLIASLIGILRLKVENSFIDYFHKSTEIYRGMKVIDQSLGGTTPLDVIVDFGEPNTQTAAVESAPRADDTVFDEFTELDKAEIDEKYWFTSDKMSRIKSVHAYLDSLPGTGKVLSLASMWSIAEKLNGGKPLDSFELALLYSETPDKFRSMLIKPYVSVNDNEARFLVRVKDSEKTLHRNELLKKIKRDLIGKLGFSEEHVHLTGLLVLYNNMLQSLFGSLIVTLGITVLMLTGMFLVLFRSLKIALIAMIPNVLPVSVVLGVMGWLNIPLDMMTITIAAISMGIAVDTTIHYIHRFKHEFQKDRKYLPTMYRCHGSIGRAMYYTSATIIMGFSILALSNFIPSVYFGLLTGLVMFIAILAALTLLPQLLILVKPFGKES
ncbi:MAG: MMPL family transporter [Sedimentisphaerales bacterium]|nr:MMPL family transporter [Sedimentisphaerales bacterium]